MDPVTRASANDRRAVARRASDRVPRSAAAGPLLAGMRVSWAGVWGGVAVGLGTLFLLTALGLAIGFTVLAPGATAARSAGVGAGLWAAVSMLVSLFIGGLVSTRIGLVYDGAPAFFEGALVWVVSVLVIGILASGSIGLLANTAFQLMGAAPGAEGSPVGGTSVDLSAAAWWTFAPLVLSLIAAVLGAMVGRRGAAARVADVA